MEAICGLVLFPLVFFIVVWYSFFFHKIFLQHSCLFPSNDRIALLSLWSKLFLTSISLLIYNVSFPCDFSVYVYVIDIIRVCLFSPFLWLSDAHYLHQDTSLAVFFVILEWLLITANKLDPCSVILWKIVWLASFVWFA